MFGVIAIVFILMYLNEMYKNRRLESKINELEDRRVKAIKDRIDREDRIVRELDRKYRGYEEDFNKFDKSLNYSKGYVVGKKSGIKKAKELIKKEFKMEG